MLSGNYFCKRESEVYIPIHDHMKSHVTAANNRSVTKREAMNDLTHQMLIGLCSSVLVNLLAEIYPTRKIMASSLRSISQRCFSSKLSCSIQQTPIASPNTSNGFTRSEHSERSILYMLAPDAKIWNSTVRHSTKHIGRDRARLDGWYANRLAGFMPRQSQPDGVTQPRRARRRRKPRNPVFGMFHQTGLNIKLANESVLFAVAEEWNRWAGI
jgi:hypothetical protein